MQAYQFTFRQEQLAKLTPSELIEVAYLGTLLEQEPHSRTDHFSGRFNTLMDFHEQVVSVVPIESLVNTIAHIDGLEAAVKCCNVLMSCGQNISPSIALVQSSVAAWNRINQEIDLSRLATGVYHSHPHAQQLQFLSALVVKSAATVNKQQHHAICGISLDQDIYPVSAAPTSVAQPRPTVGCTLKPPLKILREGSEKLHCLADPPNFEAMEKTSTNTEAQTTKLSLSALYNAKMLAIVKNIREDDLKIYTSLLTAFMEDQIQVPLIKTSIDTAKALNFMLTTAAVGVWALFSLNQGDIRSIVSSIPARSLHVRVQEYIRSIFKQESLTADEKYAGKLQFMVQGLEKTVSCNSHYISYSLEHQLLELCKNLSINRSTPLQTLISEWDTIFKDDVLALVAPTHRSLIARWLKWALMVHHLREELAKYTAVGVVGLVNSGKSRLVNTLFKIRVRLYRHKHIYSKKSLRFRYP